MSQPSVKPPHNVAEGRFDQTGTGPVAVEEAGFPLDDDTLYEVIRGKQVEKPMGYYECRIAFLLGYHLEHFARTHGLGRTTVEMLFRIDPTRALERRPDVAFVSYQRWPRERKMAAGNAWEVIPDLAVEVVSPTNRADEVAEKLAEYFQAGVQLVWVIYPKLRQVYVHESPAAIRVLEKTQDLDGAAVLPGFRLPVATLFEDGLEEAGGAGTAAGSP